MLNVDFFITCPMYKVGFLMISPISISFSKSRQGKYELFKKKKKQVLAFQKGEKASIRFSKMLYKANFSFSKRRHKSVTPFLQMLKGS